MKNLKNEIRITRVKPLFQKNYNEEASIINRKVTSVILEQIDNIAFHIEDSLLNRRATWHRTDGHNVRIFHST